jgi:putative transport protein
MDWLRQLITHSEGVAHAVLVMSVVAAVGLGLGSLKVRGVGLGVAGVLFAGLAAGHFGLRINHEIQEFAREFGLILFVYTIGIQVGPGFIASLRRNGLPMNLMAAAVVLLGVAVTLGVAFLFMSKDEFPVAVGLFAGATTNTPSLAAAQQALKDVPSMTEQSVKLPGLGYAVAYPFGIIGIILTMVLVRVLFRVNLQHETEAMARADAAGRGKLETINLEVRNPNLDNLPLRQLPTLAETGVVISRVMKNGKPMVARPELTLQLGDVLHAVGPREKLDDLKLIVGAESKVDVKALPGAISSRRILVTKSESLGKSVHELDLGNRFGVRVTRINRAEVELPPTPGVKLQYGDNLVVVGEEDGIKRVADELGDSVKRLNHPHIIPVFVGIALGVILGSWPISVPGMPAPVRLGLAGGPLLVAIILSRLGNVGSLVWYMPISANFMLREVGIVLFLACVGIRSGDRFVETLVNGHGVQWMLYGALITLVPLVVVGLFARVVMKLNFLPLSGLLAGSMTDPPALAFAGAITGSDAPGVAYATVYPLVMLLRVLCAQAMVLMFFR